MLDRRLIDWLSAYSETMHIRHNAHRETNTTVARHLLHRERLGDTIRFDSTASRIACMEYESLWELSVRHLDGTETHIAGTSLDSCLELAGTLLKSPDAIAA